MVFAGAMQMSVDKVVDMVSVRHSFMTTVFAMLVSALVTFAVMVWSTCGLIKRTFAERMLVDVIIMHMMKMTVMQEVCVIVMLNDLVSTARAMLVVMFVVFLASHFSLVSGGMYFLTKTL